MISAGIDIGTNTFLMVIADVVDGVVNEIHHEYHSAPRLGEGVSISGEISPVALERTLLAVEECRALLSQYQPQHIRAVATSAIREASNGIEVRNSLEHALGCSINVIGGNEEAELTFLGTTQERSARTLMIDIGGGSTEYAIGNSGVTTATLSLPIGAVRYAERYSKVYPPTNSSVEMARADVLTHLSPSRGLLEGCTSIVGVAGTPSALAMIDLAMSVYDRTLLDGHIMTIDRVKELSDFLCGCSLSDLHAIPGIHERRADIVPMGSVILYESMKILCVANLACTTRGLRYGALLSANSSRVGAL